MHCLQVYYELAEARAKANLQNVAIARVEQISPFPFDLVHKHADVSLNGAVELKRRSCVYLTAAGLPQRRDLLGSRGAQEPGCMVVCATPPGNRALQVHIPCRQARHVRTLMAI